jgi:methyl-accepting chemotaxis protein
MLQDVKIGMRLGVGFGLMLLLIIVVGAVGYWGVEKSTSATIGMLKGDATLSENASRARANVLGMRRYEKDLFLNMGDRAKEDEYYAKWKEEHEHLGARMAELERCATLARDKEKIAAMKAEEATYEKGFAMVYAQVAEGKLRAPAAANKAITAYKDAIHAMEKAAKELAEETSQRMEAQEKVMAGLAKQIGVVVAVSIVIGIVLCLLVSTLITRSIIVPLSAAVEIADRLSQGDLTAKSAAVSKDEVGQLLVSMNNMADKLRLMMARISATSSQVASAASQISSGSEALGRAAQSQSSATEETSSTMVQMAVSIQSVAQHAGSLLGHVGEVSSSIQELGASSEQVAKSSEQMASAVAETSATIEEMIASIDRVAENTEELAASVSETSATIEQMTVSIGEVAQNSQGLQQVVTETSAVVGEMTEAMRRMAGSAAEANAVASVATKEAVAGQTAVQEALAAMQRVSGVITKTADSVVNLGRHSDEIGNIVQVISQIADQTNLLALNAAIEAARAGDAGRGFAVVADEVRKLAERSVNATKEIGEVIKQVQADTLDSVKYGELATREAQASMDLSGVAGNALANIVRNIEQSGVLMAEIAAMTEQQAAASLQVNESVEKMSRSALQVASAAKEQAFGGRQIRIAVEKMNSITREVTGATREQSQGGKQIRIALESMNGVTRQVSLATREQAFSSGQILEAVTGMSSMTKLVADATSEQKKGGDMVVLATENISSLTRDNLAAVEQFAGSARELTLQANELIGMVGAFRVG